MCCSTSGYSKNEIDGVCPDCGEDTCNGNAFESCSYSPVQCETCGSAPCDESC